MGLIAVNQVSKQVIAVGTPPRQVIALTPAARQVIAGYSAQGRQGIKGDPGTNGVSVELQVTATHIQWRQVGAEVWTDLVELQAIKGLPGDPGTDGAGVELQVTATHIQWRQVGAEAWTDLIALLDLIEGVTLPASEAVTAGDFVDIYEDAGISRVRRAEAALLRAADGFVLAGAGAGAPVLVRRLGQINGQLAGLTPGRDYYLSVTSPGGVQDTPPASAGQLRQRLGVATSATSMLTEPGMAIELLD